MPSYAITTAPGREQTVVASLAETSIAAYAPTQRRRHFTDRRTTTRDTPLFPGYVFVTTDELERDYEAIRHAPHVSGFLTMNGRARPIPDAWLAQFLLIQTFGGFDYTRDRRPKLRIGQAVRVIAGQFAALDVWGTVTAIMGGRATLDTRRGPFHVGVGQLEAA